MTLSTSRPVLSLCALLLAACSSSEGGAGSAAGGGEAKAAPAPTGKRAAAAGVPKVATPPPPLPADPGGARGVPGWAVRLGGNAAESGRAVVVSDNGDIYLAGLFRGQVDFGAGARYTARRADGFLARL